MNASISVTAETNELTITVHDLNWEQSQQRSCYAGEVQVRDLLQLIGQTLTVDLLRSKEVTVARLEQAGETYYRKAATPGHYQTPYGEVVVTRHLYQSSAGARPFVRWNSRVS